MDYNGVYVGTELKFILTITGEGFDMRADDFDVTIRRGTISITYRKEELLDDGENYYIPVSTDAMGVGKYELIVTAYVPDDDFEDGTRKEVYKQDLFYANAV